MDDTTKLLADLIAGLGKSLGMDDLQLDEDGFCCLGFDDAITVTMYADDASGAVVLSSELGEVDEEQEDELLRSMLHANFAWRETGGIGTLSLAPREDEQAPVVACMMHQVPLRGLDEAAFTALFDKFLETAEAWTEFIVQFDDDDEAPEAAPPVQAEPHLRRV